MSGHALRIIPLGGLGEIGMNCMVLEYEDEIIIVDCGVIFSDLDQFGVEFGIPDFSYLKEKREAVKAIVLTHGHEDHIGAVPFLLKSGIDVPIYASPFTSLLVRERLREHGLLEKTEIRTFKIGESFGFKHFQIKTESVNHSIIDSSALFIDTPVGKIIHTGDFKMDPTPYFSAPINMKTFGQAGDDGVLLLLSDSTNVERHEHAMSESVILKKFEQLFATAEGLTIVSMFASNVARMGQVFELAGKMGKKIALAGRSMEQNVRLGTEVGFLKQTEKVLIPLDQINSYPRDKVIVLSTGSQGEHRAALLRVANGEHGQIKLQKGDLVLMSSKFIPGNEKAIGRMINQLFRQGAQVLYEAIHDIHVSGHATRPELKIMLQAVRPKYFIPIHGEYRHLVHHSMLARECKIPEENVLIATNGDVIELAENEPPHVVDRFEETRVLVEGREGSDITKLVLKERRQMGEKGIVFALLVRNAETRRIMSGPEIIVKGLVSADLEAELISESRDVARKYIIQYEDELRNGSVESDLQENIRIGLRRFYSEKIGKKPIVLPMILDL